MREDNGFGRRGLVGALGKAPSPRLCWPAWHRRRWPSRRKPGQGDRRTSRSVTCWRNIPSCSTSAKYSEWGKLFGDKGTLELNGAVWATGAEGIAKKMADVMAANPKPITGITGDHMYRHIFTNTHITGRLRRRVRPRRTPISSCCMSIKACPRPSAAAAAIATKFARESGEWHFTAKRMDFDWSDAA